MYFIVLETKCQNRIDKIVLNFIFICFYGCILAFVDKCGAKYETNYFSNFGMKKIKRFNFEHGKRWNIFPRPTNLR